MCIIHAWSRDHALVLGDAVCLLLFYYIQICDTMWNELFDSGDAIFCSPLPVSRYSQPHHISPPSNHSPITSHPPHSSTPPKQKEDDQNTNTATSPFPHPRPLCPHLRPHHFARPHTCSLHSSSSSSRKDARTLLGHLVSLHISVGRGYWRGW